MLTKVPDTTRHHVLPEAVYKKLLYKFRLDSESEEPPSRGIILVTKLLPVALLATCSEIYNECKPVLGRLLEELRTKPGQLIGDYDSHDAFSNLHLLLHQESETENNSNTIATRHLQLGEEQFAPDTTAHAEVAAFIKNCLSYLFSLANQTIRLERHYKMLFAMDMRPPADINDGAKREAIANLFILRMQGDNEFYIKQPKRCGFVMKPTDVYTRFHEPYSKFHETLQSLSDADPLLDRQEPVIENEWERGSEPNEG